MLVMKFGGASLANSENFSNAVDWIIKQRKVVVVVSAASSPEASSVVVVAASSVVPLAASSVVVVEAVGNTVIVSSVVVVASDTEGGSTVHVPYVVATTRAPPTKLTCTFHLAHTDFNQSNIIILLLCF